MWVFPANPLDPMVKCFFHISVAGQNHLQLLVASVSPLRLHG